MNLEPVIGIEVHCELKTKTKMFSSAPVSFNAVPNSLVQPLDLALPGTLPRVNKRAVEMALLASKALNMEIDNELVFDRKNYFYTDLAKGFQITQDKRPIGRNGYLEIETDGSYKKIRINRLHMEEDTAKQTHFDDYTLIDYNRSGNPLIEIVSDPDLRSAKEACKYIENLRATLLYLGVSDVKMEEGSMRCDINISLKEKGSSVLGTKTEIKNLNSISNVEKAIEYEIERQSKLLQAGKKIIQETRRFDEESKTTVTMRVKNDSLNYKYFCEPNIAPIKLSDEYIDQVLSDMPLLPVELNKIYTTKYNLSAYDSEQLLLNKEISDFFNECVKIINEPKLITNFILGDVLAFLNKRGLTISECNLTPNKLADLIKSLVSNAISSKQAKIVLNELLESDKSVEQIIKEKGLVQISDENEIRTLVNIVLSDNKNAVKDYLGGKTNILGFLVGQVMKLSKGKANPELVNTLILEEINKLN